MKKSTKILALVLSLVMVLALMPMGAMADSPIASTENKILESGNKVITDSGAGKYDGLYYDMNNANTANIQLNVPGKEAVKTDYVVYVLDKSTSAESYTTCVDLFDKLNTKGPNRALP